MQRFLVLMLLLAASTISLTGCGNKGPLYLPQAPVQQISTPAEVSEEAPEETVESEDSSDAPEDAPEDSPENTEAAEEPETTEED